MSSRFLNKCNCAENQSELVSLFALYSDKNQTMMTMWPIWDWGCYQCTPKMILKVFSRTGILTDSSFVDGFVSADENYITSSLQSGNQNP